MEEAVSKDEVQMSNVELSESGLTSEVGRQREGNSEDRGPRTEDRGRRLDRMNRMVVQVRSAKVRAENGRLCLDRMNRMGVQDELSAKCELRSAKLRSR